MSRARPRGPVPRGAGLGLVIALALVVASCSVSPTSAGVLPEPDGGADGWELILDEGFDGAMLDPATWGTCHWWAEGDGCTIASNDELEWYQPHRVSVADGTLRLEAAREEITDAEGNRYPFTSGMISSGRPGDDPSDEARFAFTYGIVQARFRVPPGAGLWPAIWMLPVTNESRPEIDLLEVYGDEPDEPSMTLHHGTDDRTRSDARTADLSVGWHTVELEWTPDSLRWLIDDVERFYVQGDAVPDEPMYLVLNLAVGGSAGPPDDETPLPAVFEVDELRVWSRR